MGESCRHTKGGSRNKASALRARCGGRLSLHLDVRLGGGILTEHAGAREGRPGVARARVSVARASGHLSSLPLYCCPI